MQRFCVLLNKKKTANFDSLFLSSLRNYILINFVVSDCDPETNLMI